MNNPLILDEDKIRKLPEFERLERCENIVKMRTMSHLDGMQCGLQERL